MLKLILRQANWGIFGALFAFAIGFFVKIYVIDIVELEEWGRYAAAQTFSSLSETFLSIGIPFVIIKFFPSFIDNNKEKASRVANVFIRYAFIIGGLFVILIYFGGDSIADYYSHIDHLEEKDKVSFSWILFVMCLHVPISMLFGVVVSLYRSVLKIKEIVLYGTVISVLLRAILTFSIFQDNSDITHFILIEVFTQIIVLSILLYLFNKNEFSLFIKSNIKEVTGDSKMTHYGLKIFLNSLIGFFSGYALSLVISLTLEPQNIGAYNILLTLTGLTTFLLINLNKVFAPAISKLYHENKISDLNELYKRTTFFINLFTIPLVVIIMVFSSDILSLYTSDMLEYKNYLFFMLFGGMCSLAAGSSGTFMTMAGLEKQNLFIQLIRAFLLIVLSISLIKVFPNAGMDIIVILYVTFMLLVNVSQLFYIRKHINISPFSRELLVLFLLAFIVMYSVIQLQPRIQNFEFKIIHYFIVPIFIYLGFLTIMFRSVKRLIKELL